MRRVSNTVVFEGMPNNTADTARNHHTMDNKIRPPITVSGVALEHYKLNVGPVDEFGNLPETKATPRNIGWTLGNDCPYRCTHCYSMNARVKGKDMSKWMVDRIVRQLSDCGIETVNLGGNEPLFTNGVNPKNTLLPYIISSLAEAEIRVGLTTSGITILRLYAEHKEAFMLLNDVDVSFDSPFPEEHNSNRGARIYDQAIDALRLCRQAGIPRTVILAAMKWNFSTDHINGLYRLACSHNANIRINPLKPVLAEHLESALPAKMYYQGFAQLMQLCDIVDLGEPPLAAVTEHQNAKRCPCGRTSFRIHSITPQGRIHVSPCVYLHDYKSELDLLEHNLSDIIDSPQFKVFRQRNANPSHVIGCERCSLVTSCGGGCAARSYLYALHSTIGKRTFRARDPYCPKEISPSDAFPANPQIDSSHRLVHMDYLCTWIGRPKEAPDSRSDT